MDELKAVRNSQGVIRTPNALMTDVSGERNVGTGSDIFSMVFDRGIFVDKSMLVKDVLTGFQAKLFCRPRRFGKTLAATMLQDFFECAPCADPAARSRFERLSIWEADGDRWREHQGCYPVVMLSLKEAASLTWEQTLGQMAALMARECDRHAYVLESPDLGPGDRAWFERVRLGEGSYADLAGFLRQLSRILHAYHGERCMIIVDEYDQPITRAHARGYYDEAVEFMRNWLSGGLKTNPSLAYGVLTGVQRISKESIFSGLNNIEVNTALNQVSDERFGFTQDEVAGLAAYLGRVDKLDDLRAWYDGYRFGAADIYNPWSVLSFFARGCVCQPYWLNTSSNTILEEAQRGNDPYVLNDLLSLLEPGATVEHPVDPNIAYGDLGSDPEAVWSVLYMSGYLTTDDTDFPDDPSVVRRLRVPNAEVRTAFRREVADRARKAAGGMGRLGALHRAILSGDEQAFGRELGFIARNSASYYDLTNEAACHMMVFGLLFGMPGYGDPLSNREAGYGRYDIQVVPADPTSGLPCVTVEVKFLHPEDAQDLGEKTSEALAALAREALGQISAQGYDAAAPGLRWGVAFAGKRVAVACERAR